MSLKSKCIGYNSISVCLVLDHVFQNQIVALQKNQLIEILLFLSMCKFQTDILEKTQTNFYPYINCIK